MYSLRSSKVLDLKGWATEKGNGGDKFRYRHLHPPIAQETGRHFSHGGDQRGTELEARWQLVNCGAVGLN